MCVYHAIERRIFVLNLILVESQIHDHQLCSRSLDLEKRCPWNDTELQCRILVVLRSPADHVS